MLVVPCVGVVLSSLTRMRGVLAMRLMIMLKMAVVMHVDISHARRSSG